jgi:ABC-2 type transport system permease protein
MPIHEVGYRGWNGKRTSQFSRWWIISSTGIRLAAKSRWVRRILFVAWLPVMYWGIGFFFVEKTIDADSNVLINATKDLSGFPGVREISRSTSRDSIRRALSSRFAMFPHAKELAESFKSNDTARIRNDVWRWLLMVFFRYPQAILILFLIGTVAPALISRDMRSRAFLLYFSRPIGKLEYIFGKLCIPAAFIIAVTTLPALALYVFAIMMSPSFDVFWNTWDIPIRIVAATFALVIPTASVALMLSSLTQESRFANFSWFAVWALGHGAWLTIVVATAMRMQKPPIDPAVMQSDMVRNWSAVSLYNCLGSVQALIFGFESFNEVWRGVFALSAITIVSLFILYRRVSAPIRI